MYNSRFISSDEKILIFSLSLIEYNKFMTMTIAREKESRMIIWTNREGRERRVGRSMTTTLDVIRDGS